MWLITKYDDGFAFEWKMNNRTLILQRGIQFSRLCEVIKNLKRDLNSSDKQKVEEQLSKILQNS